jgi:hypothetical protein
VRLAPYKDKVDSFQTPVDRATGTAESAGQGARTGLRAAGDCLKKSEGAGEFWGFALIFCTAFIPVSVVVGTIVGITLSHSEEEVTIATVALKKTLAEAAPNDLVTQAVTTFISELEDGKYEARSLSGAEAGLSSVDLAKQGIDAVIDLEVTRIDLAVFGELDPDAAITLNVRGRFRDSTDDRALPNLSWFYVGERHDYFDLAADDARLLRSEIEQGYEKISRLIVSDLL